MKKIRLFTVCVATLLAALSATGAPLRKIMSAPLITGASVSADWVAESPGKILARKHTPLHRIETITMLGGSSVEVWPLLSGEDFSRFSSIIALDLFFWDSRRPGVKESGRVLARLIRRARTNDIPIVIGDVPKILPDQISLDPLNREIRRLCSEYSKCRIFPLRALYREIRANGGLTIRGRWYSTKALLPDGIHFSGAASRRAAEILAGILGD